MSDNVVNTSTIANIYRKIDIEQDFSKNDEARKEEKLQLLHVLNEPIRKLEFDLLIAICSNLKYKPYKSLKLYKQQFNTYGIPKIEYCISINQSDIEGLLPTLESEKSIGFLVLYHEYYKDKLRFYFKDSFKQFDDSSYITKDKLYNKLYSLGINSVIKSIYYFLTHFRYNFIEILESVNKPIYKELSKIDDYLYENGYHKRLISSNLN